MCYGHWGRGNRGLAWTAGTMDVRGTAAGYCWQAEEYVGTLELHAISIGARIPHILSDGGGGKGGFFLFFRHCSSVSRSWLSRCVHGLSLRG